MTIPCIVSCPLNDLLVAKTSGRCRLTKKLKKKKKTVDKNFSPHFILSVDGAMHSCDGVKKDLVTLSLELISGINVLGTDLCTLALVEEKSSHHLSSIINATNFLIA